MTDWGKIFTTVAKKYNNSWNRRFWILFYHAALVRKVLVCYFVETSKDIHGFPVPFTSHYFTASVLLVAVTKAASFCALHNGWNQYTHILT